MGLPVDGDCSGLGSDGLRISQVGQKTFLEVDEDGTEAAVTGVVVDSSAAIAVPPTVGFDRPFLFLLTDTETRSPLFVTVVNDPPA
jgi:serpin B